MHTLTIFFIRTNRPKNKKGAPTKQTIRSEQNDICIITLNIFYSATLMAFKNLRRNYTQITHRDLLKDLIERNLSLNQRIKIIFIHTFQTKDYSKDRLV